MNENTALIRLTDLAENTMARLPVSLVLDTSSSMEGAPLNELNRGLVAFFESLRSHPVTSRSAEVAITLFADTPELVLDFTSLKRITEVPQIDAAGGCTNLAGGVNTALDSIERCRRDMRTAGVDHYKPFLIIMTDGEPNIGDHAAAARRVRQLEADRRVAVFPIGIGEDADMDILGTFSSRGALRLKGLNFTAFFEWLSRSIGFVSTSQVGDNVVLPKEGVDQWMEF